MSDRTTSAVPGVRPEIADVHAYESGKTIEEVKRELGLTEVIKLGSNENPFAPFPEALDAMHAALSLIHTYPESSFVELRSLIGDLYDLSADHIAIAHGAGGMLETLARMFIQPGDEVVIPGETYGLYREISRFMGADVMTVPVNASFQIDTAAVAAAVTPRTKVVWLCNPNNPTSTIATSSDLSPILDALSPTGWLVLDEAYAEFADAGALPDWHALLREGRRVIVVRTFSKAYGLAGARMGYAVAAPETIRAIDTVAEPFNANRIGIAGAIATLRDGMGSVSVGVDRIRAERGRLDAELTSLGAVVAPSNTNFLFFELPAGQETAAGPSAERVTEALLHRGVIVRSAASWGFPRHLRVTIGTPEENTHFLTTLQEVLNG